MNLPSDVQPGQPVSAKAWNDLLRYLRASRVRGGPGIRVQSSAVGTTIALAELIEQALSTGGKLVHPFQVSNASGATTAKVTVRTGSVNDMVPTSVAPTELSLTSAGTWRVYLDCTLSNDAAGTITAAAVAVTSGAQPSNTRTRAYLTLATVEVVALTGGFNVSTINQLATHSLRFYACGRTASVDGTYNFWGF